MSLMRFFGLSVPPGVDPIHNFWYGPVGAQTASGVVVDESTVPNYSVCWAATRLLGGTTGWLPFNLYRKLPGGGAVIDATHPVYRLIHDAPNDEIGSMQFRAMGVNRQVNRGNFFAEIVRNGAGQPVAMYPINPSRIPPNNIKREDGRLVYHVNRPPGQAGSAERIRQEDMFHVANTISDDGVYGKGVVTAAREAIGKAMSTQAYGSGALANGGVPPFAIKGGKFRSEDDRREWRRQYAETHAGAHKAGKPLLLPEGSEAQVLGFSLEDQQFIESQQFDIEEMCRWYGTPAHLVGHLLRATFNNIEELGTAFVKYGLIWLLKLWEQEVWRKLLTKEEQQTHYAKFVVDALERGNLQNRTEAGVKKFFNGLWTLNQWAEQEDMNPIGPLGDVHFVQQAMIPLEAAAKAQQEPQQQPAPEPMADDNDLSTTFHEALTTLTATVNTLASSVQAGLDSQRQNMEGLAASVDAVKADLDSSINRTVDSIEAIGNRLTALQAVQAKSASAQLRDMMGRMLSIELHAIKHIAEKPSRFDERLKEFYGKHTATLSRNLLEPVSVVLAAQNSERQPADVVAAIVEGHVAESLRQLDACRDCKADELPGKVDECVGRWHEERSTLNVEAEYANA